MVANHTCDQLNREISGFSCPLRCEFACLGSAVLSRVSLLIRHSQADFVAYLQDSTPSSRYGFSACVVSVQKYAVLSSVVRHYIKYIIPMYIKSCNISKRTRVHSLP